MNPAFTAMLFETTAGPMVSVSPGWAIGHPGSRAQAPVVLIMDPDQAERLAHDLLAAVERARKESST